MSFPARHPQAQGGGGGGSSSSSSRSALPELDGVVYDMPLPFDPRTVVANVLRRGMTEDQASFIAQLALQQFGEVHAAQQDSNTPITARQVAESMRAYLARAQENGGLSEEEEEEEEEEEAAAADADAEMRDVEEEEEGDEADEAERPHLSLREIQDMGVSISDQMLIDLGRATGEIPSPAEATKITLETIVVDGQRRTKVCFSQDGLDEYFDGQDPYGAATVEDDLSKLNLGGSSSNSSRPGSRPRSPHSVVGDTGMAIDADMVTDVKPKPKPKKNDLITRLCANIELAVELGKHLAPKDIVSLYSANRTFHDAVKGHLLSSVRMWLDHQAPSAARIFSFKLYRRHLVSDPMGRTWADMYRDVPEALKPPAHKRDAVRTIPGLRYLQLVVGRDRYCRDILALLARSGHRMPPSMHTTLLRVWLLMDVSTTAHRQAIMQSRAWWPDQDLYNAQFFLVKLGMHCNDPVFGPSSWDLVHILMGQKGLYPLWQFLTSKRFNTLPDILEAKARYNLAPPPDHWGFDLFGPKFWGVPFAEMGTGHTEGWGTGTKHLMRLDELVPFEAVRRGLALQNHLTHMAVWGYFDWATGENLVPTEDEIFIEDEAAVLSNVDTTRHWKLRHCLKKRWTTLTDEQKAELRAYDEDEILRLQPFCIADAEYDDDEWNSDEYIFDAADYTHCDFRREVAENGDAWHPDDEITRGFMLGDAPTDSELKAPAVGDAEGWAMFVDQALMSIPVDWESRAAAAEQVIPPEDDDDDDYESDWEVALKEKGLDWRVIVRDSDDEAKCDSDEGSIEKEDDEESEEERQ